jgi:putative heme-binding domain-containing protein
LESLLQPSKNVAPRYESFHLQTRDGQTRLAFQLQERCGNHSYVDLAGNTFDVTIEDIIKRQPMPVSIMPEGLVSKLTTEEIRDLLAYLEALGK